MFWNSEKKNHCGLEPRPGRLTLPLLQVYDMAGAAKLPELQRDVARLQVSSSRAWGLGLRAQGLGRA